MGVCGLSLVWVAGGVCFYLLLGYLVDCYVCLLVSLQVGLFAALVVLAMRGTGLRWLLGRIVLCLGWFGGICGGNAVGFVCFAVWF